MAEKRYALLIGNQHYEGSDFEPLQSPHADVQALKDVLEHDERGKFDKVDILLEAKRDEAQIAIKNALESKRKNDLLLIYFSGHGKTNDDGDLFLAGSTSQVKHLETTGISAALVSKWMGRGSADKTVLILDCCHAGAFAQGFKSNDALQNVTDGYARSGGSYVLMACDAYELAKDGEDGSLSFMTQHLVAGLSGDADANGDGVITVDELTDYLDKQMSVGAQQTFNQACHDKRGDIVLSWSGSPEEDAVAVLDAAFAKVLSWAQDGSLSDDVLPQVLSYIAEAKRDAADLDDGRYALIRAVADDSIRPGNFNTEWIRVQEPTPPPQKPVTKPTVDAAPEPAEAPKAPEEPATATAAPKTAAPTKPKAPAKTTAKKPRTRRNLGTEAKKARDAAKKAREADALRRKKDYPFAFEAKAEVKDEDLTPAEELEAPAATKPPPKKRAPRKTSAPKRTSTTKKPAMQKESPEKAEPAATTASGASLDIGDSFFEYIGFGAVVAGVVGFVLGGYWVATTFSLNPLYSSPESPLIDVFVLSFLAIMIIFSLSDGFPDLGEVLFIVLPASLVLVLVATGAMWLFWQDAYFDVLGAFKHVWEDIKLLFGASSPATTLGK